MAFCCDNPPPLERLETLHHKLKHLGFFSIFSQNFYEQNTTSRGARLPHASTKVPDQINCNAVSLSLSVYVPVPFTRISDRTEGQQSWNWYSLSSILCLCDPTTRLLPWQLKIHQAKLMLISFGPAFVIHPSHFHAFTRLGYRYLNKCKFTKKVEICKIQSLKQG